MKLPFFLLTLALLLASARAATVELSPPEADRIARRIWQNESGGTLDGLTAWNDGEDFASLGIGHFIWYPKGQRGPFEESFPPLVRYLEKRGLRPPAVARAADCPWPTRADFQRAFRSPEMTALRRFLADTVAPQLGFIVQRLEAALPKMQAAAPRAKRDLIRDRFYAVASTSGGVYALIDYVNFKGEGTAPGERYKGEGWGLLQVLENMDGAPKGRDAVREFARSAKAVLTRRVKNSPPARSESRWLTGWKNRCDTYAE